MPEPVSRALVEAFYSAYAARDVEKIAGFLDENVQWSVGGPVDLLRFCGTRRGKTAVLDLIGNTVPQVFEKRRFVPEILLVDGDRAAMQSRLTGTKCDGRNVSYRVAQFLRFERGKLIDFLSVIDSFDAVEQMLGHRLNVPQAANRDTDEVVAV